MRKWIVVVVAAGGLGCPSSEDTGDDGHSTVELKVALADSSPTDVLEGTAFVDAPLEYSECLTGFYAQRPDFSAQGVRGVEIFASWEDRLCGDAGGTAPCDVVALDQNLGTHDLTVEYAVERVVENHWFAFGPVPTSTLATCEAVMWVPRAGPKLAGYDNEGNLLWETKTFEPAKASSGQGQAIQFNVGPPE